MGFQVRMSKTQPRFLTTAIFDELEAPRHYENVQQLEDHINAFLKLTRRESRVHDLVREPMVFCQSDNYHENFMIDADDRVTAIDFADLSIAPPSLAKYASVGVGYRLHFDFRQWVEVPATEGIDNTVAMMAVSGAIVMGSNSFYKLGRRLPGGDDETQDRINQALPHEVRYYPYDFGPTLGEIIAAHEANEKLGEEGDSNVLGYTTEQVNQFKAWVEASKPRKLVEDDLS
ncbi:hypothetical protein VE02_05919 [Pseudogymnoascus sp. 03VT05]|nr:hypothetical protein VE02_05919 [Pseudogymnoascus sp. 03VT05]